MSQTAEFFITITGYKNEGIGYKGKGHGVKGDEGKGHRGIVHEE